MDDILVGFDGLFPTKRLSGRFSPYNGDNENESKKFKKYKKIYYSFDKGRLERRWLEYDRLYNEEILYLHLQKRKMSVADSINRDCDCFDIIDDTFVSKKEMNIDEQKKMVKGWTLRNFFLEWKASIRQLFPF